MGPTRPCCRHRCAAGGVRVVLEFVGLPPPPSKQTTNKSFVKGLIARFEIGGWVGVFGILWDGQEGCIRPLSSAVPVVYLAAINRHRLSLVSVQTDGLLKR